ncbi:MAG: DUF4190 domain-containing protein [Bacteroidota bacterium]
MKTRYVICLLIVLLSASCNKRYGYLKKIRTDYTTNQAGKIKKVTIQREHYPELIEASDTTVLNGEMNWPAKNKGLQKYAEPEQELRNISQSDTAKVLRNHRRNEVAKDDSREISQSSKNKHSLWALVFSFLTVAFASCMLLNPFVFGLAMVLAGAFALDEGSKGYKEMKKNGQKRKWMALTGILLGGLVLASAIALVMTFALLFSSSGASTLVVIGLFAGFFAALYSLLLYASFNDIYAKRDKPVKPVPPPKPVIPAEPKAAPDAHSYNRKAILSLICAGIFFISVIITLLVSNPVVGLVLMVSPILALIMGLIALSQIRKTHEKGKWMAWLGILAVPVLLVGAVLIMSPVLGLLALIAAGIYWLAKRK